MKKHIKELNRVEEQMKIVHQISDYLGKPFLAWVFGNILGFGALGALALVFSSLGPTLGMFASIIIISFPVSLAQWVILRRIFPTSAWWILTIPIGLLLAVLIFKYEIITAELLHIMENNDESIAVITVLYLVMGFIIGLPQWLILRRLFSSSLLWLLGSSIGVATGCWLVLATDLINQSGIVSYFVGVLVYAFITGLILSRLVTHHYQDHSNPINTT